jgi:hypothetical protein
MAKDHGPSDTNSSQGATKAQKAAAGGKGASKTA